MADDAGKNIVDVGTAAEKTDSGGCTQGTSINTQVTREWLELATWQCPSDIGRCSCCNLVYISSVIILSKVSGYGI